MLVLCYCNCHSLSALFFDEVILLGTDRNYSRKKSRE
jgi:hypothetical protein